MKRIFEEYIGKTNQDLLVEKEKVGEAMVFHCHGALSTLNADAINELVQTISAAREKKIIVDMSKVVYIDSVGVGSIAAMLKHASATGAKLILVSQPPVRDVLVLASLNKFLTICDNLQSALASNSAFLPAPFFPAEHFSHQS